MTAWCEGEPHGPWLLELWVSAQGVGGSAFKFPQVYYRPEAVQQPGNSGALVGSQLISSFLPTKRTPG